MSFFVLSLFVPDAERAIVVAGRGMFLTRTEISRFFFMLKKIIPTILHTNILGDEFTVQCVSFWLD